MKFEDYYITSVIKQNIQKLGYKRPTDIQYKSIPPILKGEDVLAIAQTGTGKTAAFAIPVLHILHERKKSKRTSGIKCLVMVPTRELALQITEVFKRLSKNTRVKLFCVFGGVGQDPQIKHLQKGTDVLVATPGRMFDLVSQGYIKLNRLEILILDEADLMLDLGFINDIRDLIRFLPNKRQTLFFSATIDKKIKKLAHSLVHNPIRIHISPKNPVAKNVDHSVAFIKMDDKRFFLERMVKEHPEQKILAFVRTKVRAERVEKAMKRMGIESQSLHGDKLQKDRFNVLKKFKEGEFRLLIATDVSARGIDIPDVSYVVNYDLPEQYENYIHRVGRTGRGTARGTAVSFCSSSELPILKEIEAYLGKEINILEIEKNVYQETLDFSEDHTSDWQSLMKEAASWDQKKKRKKK